MLTLGQQHYFSEAIKFKEVRDCISSPEEFEFKKILTAAGFTEDKDYLHQAPFTDEDFIAVADFAFKKEKIIIELDGETHEKMIEKDRKRDAVFKFNDYQVIRIKTPLTQEKKCFWKVFIQNLVNDARNAIDTPV